jgi:hypothetical protein
MWLKLAVAPDTLRYSRVSALAALRESTDHPIVSARGLHRGWRLKTNRETRIDPIGVDVHHASLSGCISKDGRDHDETLSRMADRNGKRRAIGERCIRG